jgi:hypothetical protein
VKDQSEFVSEHMQKSDRPELDSATRVIAGGRGMKNGENFGLLYEMADKIGAAGKQQDPFFLFSLVRIHYFRYVQPFNFTCDHFLVPQSIE